jgi:hypothetical protein
MRTVLAVMLFAACSPTDPTYPIEGGGDDGAGGNGSGGGNGCNSNIDANPDVLSGLVCLMPDPRDFSTCFATGAGNISVSVGTLAPVLTADDGSFTIDTPNGTNLVWTISGSNVMTSTIGFSLSAVIPAIQIQDFESLMSANGVVYDPTSGTIIGQVLHDGSGYAETTAAALPAGLYPTDYASPNDSSDWLDATSTTSFGTFLMAGLTVGSETLTLTTGSGSATTVDGVAAGSGTITFVTTSL